MSAMLLDEPRYRKLLDEALPVAIRTQEEYNRLLRRAAVLMERPEDEISEEEGRFWNYCRVSEILNGKHSISKTQAKQIAQLLHVPVDLFL